MKRYAPMFFLMLTVVLAITFFTEYLSGHADRPDGRPEKSLLVYTTIPDQQSAIIAAAYEKYARVRINFEPVTAQALDERVTREGKTPNADMVLADSVLLRKMAAKGAFIPYISETADSVSALMKDDEGAWTGIWYDPVVFCMNSVYLHTLPHIPDTWEELAAHPSIRIGMTDFLAADAAMNLYLSLLTVYGEDDGLSLLQGIHPKVVQYVKFLSTPVRMAGMGEVDVSVAVQSETLRYMENGYPLKIIYPKNGTPYTLTGVALLKEESRKLSEDFVEWLLADDAQISLQSEGIYLVPANPATLAFKQFAGKDLHLFDVQPSYTATQQSELIDRWVKNVRFKDREPRKA